jgi:hypothetical protein
MKRFWIAGLIVLVFLAGGVTSWAVLTGMPGTTGAAPAEQVTVPDDCSRVGGAPVDVDYTGIPRVVGPLSDLYVLNGSGQVQPYIQAADGSYALGPLYHMPDLSLYPDGGLEFEPGTVLSTTLTTGTDIYGCGDPMVVFE